MNNKILRSCLISLVALILVAGSFSGGFALGVFYPNSLMSTLAVSDSPPTSLPPSSGGTPEDLQTLFVPFWEAWQIVHARFVDQPLDETALMQGAIRGMMDSLNDQHSSYMDPKEYNDAIVYMMGEYEGIGAWVNTSGEYLTIVKPIAGTPAEAAGLKPGDQIVAIDGEDMTGVDPEDARQLVLGQAGTTVTLTIRREGVEELLEFTVARAKINVPSVQGEMLDNDIAYLQVVNFGQKTTAELRTTLRDLMTQNPRGLILDLRDNGGGYLETAIEVASEFIGEGVIMYEQYGDGTRTTYDAQPGGLATSIPMVVLVNDGTASASEIVAGAIQDYGRGKLIGATTYGKGSVQEWIELSDDQGAIRVTVAKWLTPNGHAIHEVGLTPDVIVDMSLEDLAAGRDPQRDSAVEVLLQMVSVFQD